MLWFESERGFFFFNYLRFSDGFVSRRNARNVWDFEICEKASDFDLDFETRRPPKTPSNALQT